MGNGREDGRSRGKGIDGGTKRLRDKLNTRWMVVENVEIALGI